MSINVSRIYLDVCCFNRPYDDQASIQVRLETEAKLHLQDMVRKGTLELLAQSVMRTRRDLIRILSEVE